ncbi:hypothetical protein F4778DRAFT_734717 [Xylariomycetidae sp. FL2044]|nr:hypothetical protein F4778DRAFT_734717 [Xylariomycetidae sp. FL2044]
MRFTVAVILGFVSMGLTSPVSLPSNNDVRSVDAVSADPGIVRVGYKPRSEDELEIVHDHSGRSTEANPGTVRGPGFVRGNYKRSAEADPGFVRGG